MLQAMSCISVCTCPYEKHPAALKLVLSTVLPEQRGSIVESLRPVVEQGTDVFAGLAIAEQNQQLVGAAWLQPQAGRTATLWPPFLADGVDHSIALQLARCALSASGFLSTVLAQTLLDSQNDSFANDLVTLGFVHLADLKYLRATVPKQVQRGKVEIELKSPAADYPDLFAQLIRQSYVATLDCPALEGLRNLSDVLDGYRTIGVHDPNLWFIAEWRGEPAGVVLLAPYPDSNQWELVYMGVVPRLRGHRIGRQILHEIRCLASRAGVDHVVLAVDAANYPALRMYELAGYVEWAQRIAYIKSVEANDTN